MSRRPGGWVGWTTIGCVALLAVIAGTVSCLHMHQLVAGHGQPGWVAALTPRSVDGMIVAASTALLVTGSVASLAANVAVAEPTATGRVIGSYELLMRQVRRSAGSTPGKKRGSAAPQCDESGQSREPSAAPLHCRRCTPSGWRRRGAATGGVAVGIG
jgi:hypothetical protein